MASFRVRTPAEYLRILWRRRYYIAVPLVIVSATLGYVIYRLPNVYESSTLVIVDPAKVNTSVFLSPVGQIDITARLSTIRQKVTSRQELLQIIDRFDLYQDLKRANAPTEAILEEMRKHIDINVRNSGSGANAFTISFRGPQPEVVKNVTAELAERFINANTEVARQQITATKDQLKNRIVELKTRLDQIEKEKTAYMMKHPEVVPGAAQSAVGQLNSLSNVLQTLQSSIDSLRAQISSSQRLLASIRSQKEVEPEKSSPDKIVEGQLLAKRADLEIQLEQLRKEFTDKFPEVKNVKAQLASIDKKLEDLKKKSEQDQATKGSIPQENPQIKNLEFQIEEDKQKLAQKQNELDQRNREYQGLQQRLQNTPILESGIVSIDRDYLTIKKEYEDSLSQKEKADMGAQVIQDLNGESFRMQDPAFLPEAPVLPKRGMLYPFSLMLGLISGLAIALAVEARYLFTIQDARDVAHYTHLPLLVTVPEIVTDDERRQRILWHAAGMVGVALLILVAIPLLVKAVQYSQVLNMFTGAY